MYSHSYTNRKNLAIGQSHDSHHLRQIFSVGRSVAVDDQSEISFRPLKDLVDFEIIGVTGIVKINKQGGGGETIDMHPADGSSTRGKSIRPSADGSAVRTSLVAGQLQAASVPIA